MAQWRSTVTDATRWLTASWRDPVWCGCGRQPSGLGMACCTEHRPGTLRTWAQDIERPTCSNGCSRPACPQPVEVGLQPVRWRHATVGFTGAGVGGRGAIALQHDAGLPAGDAHEVDLTAALGEPRVREGVPELVRTQPIDPRLLAAAANHLVEAELR